jgi:hypothetical protein
VKKTTALFHLMTYFTLMDFLIFKGILLSTQPLHVNVMLAGKQQERMVG